MAIIAPFIDHIADVGRLFIEPMNLRLTTIFGEEKDVEVRYVCDIVQQNQKQSNRLLLAFLLRGEPFADHNLSNVF